MYKEGERWYKNWHLIWDLIEIRTDLVLSSVVAIDSLFVLAVVVTQRTPVTLGSSQVALNSFPVMFHGQVVLSLPRFVLGLRFESADFARSAGWPIWNGGWRREARFGRILRRLLRGLSLFQNTIYNCLSSLRNSIIILYVFVFKKIFKDSIKNTAFDL